MILDQYGICIRVGHLCAQPIMNKNNISADLAYRMTKVTWDHLDEIYKSAKTFSFFSCFSWASIDKVAIGLAINLFNPIGSPVSSQ